MKCFGDCAIGSERYFLFKPFKSLNIPENYVERNVRLGD